MVVVVACTANESINYFANRHLTVDNVETLRAPCLLGAQRVGRVREGGLGAHNVGCPQCTLTRKPTSSSLPSTDDGRVGRGRPGSDPFLFNIVAREAKPPPLPEVSTGPTRGHKLQASSSKHVP